MTNMSTWTYFSKVFMGVDVPTDNSKPIRGGFYRGSRLFTPVADFMHVPLDQINYVICGLTSFALGQLMRRKFPPQTTSPRIRALIETMFGILLLSFCFGNQIRVLLLQSAVAYVLMVCLPQNRFMAILVTCWSLFYMTLVHLCRLQYDYGGYTLDISGPVMVQTQRLSSLAFNLVDGAIIQKNYVVEQASKLSADGDKNADYVEQMKPILIQRIESICSTNRRSFCSQTSSDMVSKKSFDPGKPHFYSASPETANTCHRPVTNMPINHIKHAVQKVPNPIEFFAYTLYFHGACVGPFIFFTEYYDYLKGYEKGEIPPINVHYFTRLFGCIVVSGLSAAYLCPYFPFDYVLTESFHMLSLFQRFVYTTISLFLIRQKYYFAWGLAELNGVAVGVGYTGRCPSTGRTLNHHIRNYNFKLVETGTGLKTVVDAWNISTTRWLREVFYDRLPAAYRTILVFIISAFWHGFYPGYYVMFLSFALFTMASRTWRRQFRSYFQKNEFSIRSYDLFTTLLTNFIINYGQAPFHLLDLSASLIFLSRFYFLPHAFAFCILCTQLIKPRFRKSVQARRMKMSLNHDRSVGG